MRARGAGDLTAKIVKIPPTHPHTPDKKTKKQTHVIYKGVVVAEKQTANREREKKKRNKKKKK